ncbi:metallophosphoesterase [Lactobacillus sp. LL6]|uniref:metallophosphoesterase n=1 Tax=Lactobacillus sp. LL6 TaxID=2596827 RepID=UPI001186863F|nr:metallophosphoesterase [Lactobacillus sp. LL6]TSO26100.1 metallophosphoesterase [Lactobacillus sp. LL6]
MKKHKFLSLLLVLILIITCCMFYAIKIEPHRLTVDHTSLNQNNGSRPLKIVQFSDVHVKSNFTYHDLDKIVKKINDQNPDVVIYSGDLYDHYDKYNDDQHVIEELKKIKANYVKLAVFGNHDRSFPAQYQNIINSSGFTLLQNQNYYLTTKNGSKVLFTGLDDWILGNSYIPANNNISNIKYKILLSHEPEQVLNYIGFNYDIALTGHSHGGQINIPGINYEILHRTHHSTKYVNGIYSLPNSNIKKMYVNSGIGTTQLNARFGVIPKISVFYLYL